MTASGKNGDPRPYDELSLLEKVATSLTEYGDPLSATAPYKHITGVTLTKSSFDRTAHDMKGEIEIHSDHQSPYGDNAQYVTCFELTETQVREIAASGPGNFRERFNQIGQQLAAKREATVEEAKRAMRSALSSPEATALKTSLPAPRRARFTKRPDG